jgi:ATP/maltotriose-dependent transcriptional regulator MalT
VHDRSTSDAVREGRAALAAGDWELARSCFETAAEELGERAEVLDGLSQAAHFQGEYDRAIELMERAFAAYRRDGERVAAVRPARWLAFLHVAVHGNVAAANGWMARAERLLEGVDDCVEHGWLALDRAPWTDDPAERERHAETALEIGRRFGDLELEFSALALLGHAYVAAGRVDEGMTLLDEALAAVTGREVVGIASIGEIYCRLLSACEHASDVRRAEQWLIAAKRFVAWSAFVPPTCRTHYGGILVSIGRWAEAEAELLAAIRVFEGGYRGGRVFPLVRLAELRLRQGRFDEAERLLEGCEWHPFAKRVLATIALARGDLGLAEDLARMGVDGADPADPSSAPALELLAAVHVARGDLGAAQEAVDRLAELAAASADERVAASADLAAGLVAAAATDPQASARLRSATERFATLDLPLESARAQLALGGALAGQARDAAIVEARLALREFERLGAAHDADRAADLLRQLGDRGRAWPRRHGTLSKRETEVLDLVEAGYSNAEIGERLFISRRTAEHHVASILSKLGLRSRAEAAAYAARERRHEPAPK